MKVEPIKTSIIRAGTKSLNDFVDEYVTDLAEDSVVVITSKAVSLCAGAVVDPDQDKDDLIKKHSAWYLDKSKSQFGIAFTITQNTLIPTAGIDESNSDDGYVLWVDDWQKVANDLREHLAAKHGLAKLGVIITDSTCTPLRRGTQGIALAHSGFLALTDYIGQPDLFGRPFNVSVSNIAGGLAAAAVVTMGEGAESTPLAIISDVPFVKFQDRNPSPDELANLLMDKDEDLFAPFLSAVDWQKGDQSSN